MACKGVDLTYPDGILLALAAPGPAPNEPSILTDQPYRDDWPTQTMPDGGRSLWENMEQALLLKSSVPENIESQQANITSLLDRERKTWIQRAVFGNEDRDPK